MVADVVLPQMGLEVSEGIVTTLLVAPGDEVAEGDTVAEVETEKAIAEVAAPRAGVVVAVEVEVGDTVPVGATLMRIGDSADDVDPAPLEAEAAADYLAAEDVPDSPAEISSESAAAPPAPVPVAAGAGGGVNAAAPTELAESANGSHRRRAAPIARRAATEIGIPLEGIEGTGPGGRITLGDVETAARSSHDRNTGASDERAPAGERFEDLSATRQSIARRLTESQLVPQYTLSRDLDAGWLLAEKARLSAESPAKVGVVDLLLQGLAEALVRHPQLAASFVPPADGEPARYRHRDGVDLGLAVATDRGLLVPVIRGVQRRGLAELVLERSRLVELTRSGRLGLEDMGSAAATLSSLGTFGVDRFTAMLNPGESSILAVGRTVERVVPRERGLAVVPTIAMTFTLDHRVVDGATGAAALAELAELLEGGMTWRG